MRNILGVRHVVELGIIAQYNSYQFIIENIYFLKSVPPFSHWSQIATGLKSYL